MGRRRHHHETSSCGLLIDLRCYTAYRPSSTTAWSKTSTGLPIAASFRAARPPALSQVSVHCPGLGLHDKSLPAHVVASDGDLVVLRVPCYSSGRVNQMYCDYFVYSTRPQHPRLDLLPNPYPACLADDDIAVLSRGDGGYVVAGLIPLLGRGREHTFVLHLYHSTPTAGAGGRWTSQQVFVEKPLRDRVCPIPDDDAGIKMFHTTNKVIIIGGDKGSIGWVDLWRGILLCDVLSETPKLRDIPLPAPGKSLHYCAHFFRSIAVNERRDTIKYVELETTLPRKMPISSSEPEPISFYEWVHTHHKDDQECPMSLVPGRWRATIYRMPVPVASSWDGNGWRRDCSVSLDDIKLPVGNPRHCKLLSRLMSTKEEQEEAATKATILSLGSVSMAYPALSTDDGGDGDVVYMLSKGRTGMEAVVAVDAKEGAVRGVAKLDAQRHAKFQRCFMATAGISIHVKTSGN